MAETCQTVGQSKTDNKLSRCSHIILTGKRKGEQCANNCVNKYCFEHNNLKYHELHKCTSKKHVKRDDGCYEIVECGVLTYSPKKKCAVDRKSTRLNSSHVSESRMPSSA